MVGIIDRGRKLADRDTIRSQSIAPDRDANLALFAAGDIHCADIRGLLQPLGDDVVRKDAQVTRAAVAFHGDVHDWLGSIVLLGNTGAVGIGREPLANSIHLLSYIRRRRIQVSAEEERTAYHGDARLGRGVDLLQAADTTDGVLDRLSDQRFHFLRVRPSVGCIDGDDGEIHFWIQLRRQPQIADESQHQECCDDHQNCNGASNRQPCDTHRLYPVYSTVRHLQTKPAAVFPTR